MGNHHCFVTPQIDYNIHWAHSWYYINRSLEKFATHWRHHQRRLRIRHLCFWSVNWNNEQEKYVAYFAHTEFCLQFFGEQFHLWMQFYRISLVSFSFTVRRYSRQRKQFCDHACKRDGTKTESNFQPDLAMRSHITHKYALFEWSNRCLSSRPLILACLGHNVSGWRSLCESNERNAMHAILYCIGTLCVRAERSFGNRSHRTDNTSKQ